MLEMGCLVGLFLNILLLLVVWRMFAGADEATQLWMKRLPTITGLVFIIGGVFFLPWLQFSPWQYLNVPDLAINVLPQIMEYLAKSFKYLKWLLYIVPIFEMDVKGYMVWALLTPTLTWSNFMARFAIILPILLMVIFLLWSLWNYFLSDSSSELKGKAQAIAATFSMGLLIYYIPTIDALGANGDVNWGIMVVLSGANIGLGVWVTIIGLVWLIFGGLIEMSIALERRDKNNYR